MSAQETRVEAHERRGRFRNPMDAESVRKRLAHDNQIYLFAVHAVGHQSAYTVDKLSWKLKQILPDLIADLAVVVERENAEALANPLHLNQHVRAVE